MGSAYRIALYLRTVVLLTDTNRRFVVVFTHAVAVGCVCHLVTDTT